MLDFNLAITERILSWLDINATIERTVEFAPIIENDPREKLLDKNEFQQSKSSPYIQVFPELKEYQESLSLLDVIFCEGPLARKLILD